MLLAAVIVYLGVRAELRGEIDSSLGNVAGLVEVRLEAPAPTPGAFNDAGPLDRERLRRREEPFGGATGYVQLVTDGGAALPPPGVGRPRVPVDPAARRIARAGTGENLADMTVDGTHLGSSRAGSTAAARCRWHARSPRSTNSSAGSC